jgi:tetratricopeptide (TPR) repeat protein
MIRSGLLTTGAAVLVVAAWSLGTGAGTAGLSERARLVAIYDEILAARFDRARDGLRAACPPAPPVACLALDGVVSWWQIVFDPESRRFDAPLQQAADTAIAAATAWTEREPGRAESWFYLAGSYAPLVQWRILRGQRLAAAREGSRIKSALERALALDPSLHDAKFGIGLYRYYADVIPAPAKVLRWLLLLPGGDKVRGLREMLDARDGGALLTGEADFQLHGLYLWYERQPARALDLLRGLAGRYPTNPVFLQRIAEVHAEYLHDHPASAAAWATLVDRATHGQVASPRLAEARGRLGLGSALDLMAETDRAIEHFEAVAGSRTPEPHGASAEAHLRLGAAHDRLGDRRRAVEAYRQAIAAAPEIDAARIATRARAALARTPNARDAEAYRASLEGLRALDRGDLTTATARLEHAIAIAPSDAIAAYRYARVIAARGDRQQAKARLEQLLQRRPEAPAIVRASAHTDYARILEDAGDRERAAEHYRYALEVTGGAPDAHDAARAGLERIKSRNF